MKKIVKSLFIYFILFFCISCKTPNQSFLINKTDVANNNLAKLAVDGTRIINQNYETVKLKGVNLGNWLVLEMWMLSLQDKGIKDQFQFETILKQRFGVEEKNRLMEIYRENWITERDFKIIKSFKMNLIRLPFEYRILEDERTPFKLREDAWRWFDWAIEMAEKYGFYIILDMHGAPGRQSNMDHTGRADYNRLWTDKRYEQRTVWLWKEIARRYRNRNSVVAFDILNEPWGGKKEQLRSLILRCYKAIRSEDCDTIIIFPGFYDDIEFYGAPFRNKWTNIMFTVHFYPGFWGWGRPDVYTHSDFIQGGLLDWRQKMETLGAPLYVGEFNVVFKKAGGGEMMRRYFDAYTEPGWPATMWSYKVLTKEGGIGAGAWGIVVNKEPLLDIDIYKWNKEKIEEFFRSLSTMEYVIDEDLQYWLTIDKQPASLSDLPPPPPKITVAPLKDDLPESWFATDIGGSLPGGQEIISKDAFIIYGGGNDIWNEKDQFRFVWQKLEGDFILEARVTELMDVHYYSKAGLMIRETVEPDSVHILINVFPEGGMELGFRIKKGFKMQAQNVGYTEFPVKFKLEKRDKIITAFVYEKKKWSEKGKIMLDLKSKEVYAGLAVLSHDNSQLVKAAFDEIKLSKLQK